MRSHTNNLGLLPTQKPLFVVEEVPDCESRLQSIHYRHVEVCDDEQVLEVLGVSKAYGFQRLSSIVAEVNLLLGLKTQSLKEKLQGNKTHLVVINNHNSVVLELHQSLKLVHFV